MIACDLLTGGKVDVADNYDENDVQCDCVACMLMLILVVWYRSCPFSSSQYDPHHSEIFGRRIVGGQLLLNSTAGIFEPALNLGRCLERRQWLLLFKSQIFRRRGLQSQSSIRRGLRN